MQTQNLFEDRVRARLLTLGLFVIVTGALIIGSGYLPFGTDNNETFSSLLHAKNMAQFGFFSFGGLTNETTSVSPAAQAYLYTHQGNFPRLFAYVLYIIGAKSAELQIILTTGTVGLAGIMMAHVFMERRVDPLFAFLFCAVLTTDYLMSLQWLVNTWRIWQLVFFFAPLLIADRLVLKGVDKWSVISLVLVFAANFYCEIIFAIFVAGVFAAYLGFRSWRRPAIVIGGWGAGAIGSILAIAILIGQIIWVLGWDNFVKDISLTFFSRNNVPAGKLAEYQEAVLRFAQDNHIVFWDNYNTFRGPLQDPIYTLKILFRYTLLQMTAPIMMLCFIIATGVGVREILEQASSRFTAARNWMCKPATAALARACIVPAFAFFGSYVVINSRALGLVGSEFMLVTNQAAIPFVAFTVSMSCIVMRIADSDRPTSSKISELVAILAIATYVLVFLVGFNLRIPAASALVVMLCCFLCFLYHRLGRVQIDLGRVLGVVATLVVCGILARTTAGLFVTDYATGGPVRFDVLTLKIIHLVGGHTVWKMVILLTGLTAVFWVIAPPTKVKLTGLCIFVGAGAVGFLFVATLSFGYIITAYFARNCPFVVYLTAIFPALLVYVLLQTLPSPTFNFRRAFSTMSHSQALAAPVLAATLFTWFSAQSLYLHAIPPARMTPMFRELAKLGSTSISNTYATPISIKTGEWSYFDPIFFVGGSVRDHGRIQVSLRDYRYLWFADGLTNPAYKKPDYFVCWMHLNFLNVVEAPVTCGGLQGILEMRDGTSPLHHVEVAKDDKRDLWTIVKLDWSEVLTK